MHICSAGTEYPLQSLAAKVLELSFPHPITAIAEFGQTTGWLPAPTLPLETATPSNRFQ